MPSQQMTGLARIPLNLLRGAERYGLERDELMRLAGLSPSELVDPDSRISVGKIWTLWRVVIDRIQDPQLGLHLGSGIDVREFGLIGYALYHSDTLRQALERLSRYSRIVSEALVVHYVDHGDRGQVVVDKALRLDQLRHPIDSRLASLLTTAREITGADVFALEARFPYPRPEDVAEHQRLFGGALLFDEPETMVVFARHDLDRPVVHADQTLSGYLDHLADEVLETLDQAVNFRQRVRRAIWSHLSEGKPSMRQIARQLGVSPRTLQRRLEEEKTSFAAELDSLRHEMAAHLLLDRSLAVYEVAFLLGYSEPSTFYRAFRRWERVSPQEFRRSVS
jgi:AraC-like DNA-binding protein